MRLEVVGAPWARKYAQEAERIGSAVGDLALHIEHIGSTAVPGILGKPILDVGMLVRTVEDFEAVSPAIRGLGYADRGQHGEDPLRRYFTRDEGRTRVVQLHVWCADAPAWKEALVFRDALRRRADLRAAYGEEKRRAAEATGWSKGPYSLEKAAYVERTLVAEGIRVTFEGEVRQSGTRSNVL